jgi:hypothetical protein
MFLESLNFVSAPVGIGAISLIVFSTIGVYAFKRKNAGLKANVGQTNQTILMKVADDKNTSEDTSMDNLMKEIALEGQKEDSFADTSMDSEMNFEQALGLAPAEERKKDVVADNIPVNKQDPAWKQFSETAMALSEFAKNNATEEELNLLKERESKKYWVNWMYVVNGKATLKNGIFTLNNKWGTTKAVEELTEKLTIDANFTVSEMSSFGVLSVHYIVD